jgi:peptidyl-prolyl cis-trans isomerase D
MCRAPGMLSFFRKGGVAQFLVAAIAVGIIVVFVLEFRTGRGSGAAISRECAVEVAGECVDGKDFNAALGLIVPRGEVSGKKLRELALRKQTLDGLVERELLLREADRLGIAISDDEIDEELQHGRARVSMPAAESLLAMRIGLCEPNEAQSACAVPFETYRLLPVRSTQSGAFDYKIYERVVRNTTNRSPKEFREMQRRELIATRMRDLVRSRARISEAEALTAFERDNSRAVVRSVEVKRDWMLKYAVDVSDAAVDRWSFENKEQVDEAWKGQKDQFKPGCLLANELTVEFSPGMEDDAKAELRKKIDEARAKIAAGAAFEAAALQTGSAGSGEGGPRCLDGANKPPEDVLAAAQKLKPGELSPVIETANGFHLVKLLKKLGEQEVAAVGRRTVARKLAVRFLADDLAKRFSNDLIGKVKDGGDLEQATRDLTQQYARTSAPKPAAAPKAPPAASAPAAESPATSDPDRPAVDVSPPFNMALNPIPDALPTESPGTIAFGIEKPNAVHPAPIATRSGFVVMQLKEKTLAKRDDFAKERQSLMRKMREAKERDAVVRYLVELRKNAESKIKIDPRFAEEPKDGNANPDG